MNKNEKQKILYPNNKNGVYLYEYPIINGIRQYVQVRGNNKANPLILFLHGGPGSSLAGLCHILQAGWENRFTVANFDQRNTCKTYFANKDKSAEIARTGATEDFVQDIDEVVAYLHTVYDFEKLILIGFSWGSAIGSEYAKHHPENLLCYIGIGQLVNYREGIMFTCNKMLKLANSKDEKKIKQIIEAFPQNTIWNKELLMCMRNYNMLCSKYIMKSAKRVTFGNVLSSPFMTFKEKKTFFIPNYSLHTKAYETMLGYDFRQNMSYEVPVMFVFGDEETVCNPELLEECFDSIFAPIKKLEIISQASHMCFFDQSDDFFNKLVIFVFNHILVKTSIWLPD